MKTKDQKTELAAASAARKAKQLGRRAGVRLGAFLRENWIGTAVFLAVTIIFFLPLIMRIGTYSPGGDAMFNAWTLGRDHYCIMHQGCPNYADGNIFFPNKNSMLYSETQLSAGLLTLPLHFLNANPVFAYNVWTIASFFFAGWFMYLLAKRLSKNNELFSVLAGLVFMLAPYKINSMSHLQNLSIFWLPLIILFILAYVRRPRKWVFAGLFVTAALQFYASWYQMIFALIAIGVVIVGVWLFKMAKLRAVIGAAAAILLAALVTMPLALQYTKFSKANNANYGIGEQILYNASLVDYLIPNNNTVAGQLYYQARPEAKRNSYNPDSVSYYGVTLYGLALVIIAGSLVLRKRDENWRYVSRWSIMGGVIALVGFIMSLGPLLKIKSGISYHFISGNQAFDLVIPLPYMLVNVFVPQLSFIRAIGRASVLVLFGLCIILAITAVALAAMRHARLRRLATLLIVAGVIIELMPLKLPMITSDRVYVAPFKAATYRTGPVKPNPYHYATIDKAYTYIKDHDEVDNIVILETDYAYPGDPLPANKLPRVGVFEQVLWAGYHNKNIYNGYSGYFPKGYDTTLEDFIDFKQDDIAKMKAVGLRYILVDKLLSSSTPGYAERVQATAGQNVFEDGRYMLIKIQ